MCILDGNAVKGDIPINIHDQYTEASKIAKSSQQNQLNSILSLGVSSAKTSISVSNSLENPSSISSARVSGDDNVDLSPSPLPDPKIELSNINMQKAEKSSLEIITKLKQLNIDITNRIMSLMSEITTDSAMASSSLGSLSQSVLSDQIKNTQETIKKLQKKIYDDSHKSIWEKISGAFTKAFDWVASIVEKALSLVVGSSAANTITHFFTKGVDKLIGYMNKVLAKILAPLSHKAAAALMETADIIARALLMIAGGGLSMIQDSMTLSNPISDLVNAIKKSGDDVAKYAKNVLKDPSLASKIKEGSSIAGAIVGIIASIVVAVCTFGAGSGEVAAEAGELTAEGAEDASEGASAADEIADVADSLPDNIDALSEGTDSSSQTASSSSTTGESVAEDVSIEAESTSESTAEVTEDEVESGIKKLGKKLAKRLKNLLKKLKALLKDKEAIQKLISRIIAISGIIQGAAGIGTGVAKIKKGKLMQDIADLYKDKAGIDSLSSSVSDAMKLMQGNTTRDKSFMTKLNSIMKNASQDIGSTFNSYTQSAKLINS